MRGLVIALALVLGGCASLPERAPACGLGETRSVATMYFGRNIGPALGVSDAQWSAFVDREVTPRFGDGLTMYDAQGQWRDSETGAIVREPSKVLVLIFSDEAADQAKVTAIAEAYKREFHQQAVGVVLDRDCVAFQ